MGMINTTKDESFIFPEKENYSKSVLPPDLKDILDKSKQAEYKGYNLVTQPHKIGEGNYKYLKADTNARLVKTLFYKPQSAAPSMMGKPIMEEDNSHEINLIITPDGHMTHYRPATSGYLFQKVTSEDAAKELALFALGREVAESEPLSKYDGTWILIPDMQSYSALRETLMKKYGKDMLFSKSEPRIGVTKTNGGYRVDLLIYHGLKVINRSYLILSDNTIGALSVVRMKASFSDDTNMMNAPDPSLLGGGGDNIDAYDTLIKGTLDKSGIRIKAGRIYYREKSSDYPPTQTLRPTDLQLIEDHDWKPIF